MQTALSLINQAYVRGLGRTGPVRNGTDGIAAGDWEVSAVEAVDFGKYDRSIPLMVCFA